MLFMLLLQQLTSSNVNVGYKQVLTHGYQSNFIGHQLNVATVEINHQKTHAHFIGFNIQLPNSS